MGEEGTVGVALGATESFEERRGRLTLVPLDSAPFEVVRAYVLSDVPAGASRGGHACRTQQRLLVCVSGRARVTLDDGRREQRLELGAGTTLHIRPGVWHELEALEAPLVVVVLADGPYDPADYIARRGEDD